MVLSIENGMWRCAVAPDLGAAIIRLDWGDEAVLRPADVGAAAPFALSSFPLVPYVNRIRQGRLCILGVEASLPPNLSGEPHPLHGLGFLVPWTVERQLQDTVVLTTEHERSAAWPWAFTSRQELRLDGDGLLCRLRIVNTDSRPAPAGLGFHPYFRGARSARLTALLDGVWLTDTDQLPITHRSAPLRDWSAPIAVQCSALIDHCHTGWDGTARITWPEEPFAVTLTASEELNMLHIYAPPRADFFCLEPVSHRPDAHNATDPELDGIRILLPGNVMESWMRINVDCCGA